MKLELLTITKEAYLDHNTNLGAHYRALAVDAEGTQYVVIWTDINIDCSDESNAANWDQPNAIELAE